VGEFREGKEEKRNKRERQKEKQETDSVSYITLQLHYIHTFPLMTLTFGVYP